MIAHCELMGDRVAILDPPPGPERPADQGLAAATRPATTRSTPRSTGPGSRSSTRAAARTSSCRRAATSPASGPATTTPAACTRRRPTRSSAAPSTSSADHQGRAGPAQPRGHQLHPGLPRPRHPGLGCPHAVDATRRGATSTCAGSSTTSRSRSSNGTQWVVFEPNDAALWAQDPPHHHRVPRQRVAQGRPVRADPGRGVLRQVRRRDQPGRGHRRRPGRLRDRRRPVKPAEFVIFRLSQFSGGTSLVTE